MSSLYHLRVQYSDNFYHYRWMLWLNEKKNNCRRMGMGVVVGDRCTEAIFRGLDLFFVKIFNSHNIVFLFYYRFQLIL